MKRPLPSLSSRRLLAWFSIIFLLGLGAWTPAAASDYVIVVDSSGSMTKAISKKDSRVRIRTVQEALRNYLGALPADSRVTLISFNSGIAAEVELVLRSDADRARAIKFVDVLEEEAQKDGNTHLWTTLRRALKIASQYAKQNANTTVSVRVLTDGQDTEEVTTLEQVLNEFPLVDGESIKANLVLLGDLEMNLKDRKGFEITRNPNFRDLFPPVIQWAPNPPRIGQDVSFFDNSRSAYERYEWTLDGKAIGKEKAVTTKFDKEGRHTMVLNVAGTDGTRLTATQTLMVSGSDLSADFAISASEIEPGQEVKLFGRTTGKPTSCQWTVDGKAAGNTQDCSAKFDKAGDYPVKFVVKDAAGSSAQAVKTVTVKESELTTAFKASTQDVVSGQAVQFVNETAGRVASYAWDFGDGARSSERNPSHTYKVTDEQPHDFNVTLKATSPTGRTATCAPVKVHVVPEKKAPAPKAAFRIIGEGFKVGNAVQFMDDSQGLIESYAWDFGGEGKSATKNPEYAFQSAGEKTVRLTVRGPGGEASAEKKIVLQPRYQPPAVRISATKTSGDAPLETEWKAEVTGDYESVRWEFGEGADSNELAARHTYPAPGNYTVKLTATPRDPSHSPATATSTVRVTKPRPPWFWPAVGAAVLAAAALLAFIAHRRSIPFVDGSLRGKRIEYLRTYKKRGKLTLPLNTVSDGLPGEIIFIFSGKKFAPQREASVMGVDCKVNAKPVPPGQSFEINKPTKIEVAGQTLEYKP
jgi:PKD repeat protein